MSHYKDVVTALSPDQYWPLDDADGAAVVGSDVNQVEGAPTALQPAVILQEKELNKSFFFHGSTPDVQDCLNIGAPTSDYTAEFSISAWVRPTDLYVAFDYGTIVRKRDNFWLLADSFRGFSISFFDVAHSVVQTCSSNNFNTPYKWELGNAYFVVGTYDGDRLRIYVNGILSDEVDVTGSTPGTYPAYDVKIGAKYEASEDANINVFKGYISHIATFDRELDQNDVTEMYEAGWYTAAEPDYNVGFFQLAINGQLFIEPKDLWAPRWDYVVLQCWRDEEAIALKKINPDLKVLAYKNFGGMPDSIGPDGLVSAGVSYPEAVANGDESWFLHYDHDDQSPDDMRPVAGERITYYGYPWVYPADPANDDYSDRWIDNIVTEMEGSVWDGVFVDNFDLEMHYNFNEDNCAEYPPGSDQLFRWQAAMLKMVQKIRPAFLDADLLFICNLGAGTKNWQITQSWLEFMDGWLDEYMGKYQFNSGEKAYYDYDGDAEQSMVLATKTQRMGKVYLGSSAAPQGDLPSANYNMAMQLAMQRGLAYTMKHWDYGHAEWYSIYERVRFLGVPEGERSELAPFVFQRNFDHGVVVLNVSDDIPEYTYSITGTMYDGLTPLTGDVIVPKKEALILTEVPFVYPGPTSLPDIYPNSIGDEACDDFQPLIERYGDPADTLCIYLHGLGNMLKQVDDISKDGPNGEPGWSQIFDLTRTKTEWLAWTGQLVGYNVPTRPDNQSLLQYDIEQRERILTRSAHRRGTVARMVDEIKEHLNEPKDVVIQERVGGDASLMNVFIQGDQIRTSEAEVRRAAYSQKLAGLLLDFNVIDAKNYNMLRGANADYTEVSTKFTDYDEVRLDPGKP